MTDVVDLVKRLDSVTRKSIAHLREAKANAVAAGRIIEQLKKKEAIGQLSSCELAALIEASTTLCMVLEGFDTVIS